MTCRQDQLTLPLRQRSHHRKRVSQNPPSVKAKKSKKEIVTHCEPSLHYHGRQIRCTKYKVRLSEHHFVEIAIVLLTKQTRSQSEAAKQVHSKSDRVADPPHMRRQVNTPSAWRIPRRPNHFPYPSLENPIIVPIGTITVPTEQHRSSIVA
jgi:hypothetical protein